jgi:hypothetical protein
MSSAPFEWIPEKTASYSWCWRGAWLDIVHLRGWDNTYGTTEVLMFGLISLQTQHAYCDSQYCVKHIIYELIHFYRTLSTSMAAPAS